MTTLTRTLAEIQSTATKAARGAGCPWGMAEEAGMFARLLEAHGLPGVKAVATLFQTPRACPCSGADGPACGLAEAVAFSDAPQGGEIGPVAAPLLIVAAALQAGVSLRVHWEGGKAHVSRDGVLMEGGPAPDVAAVTVRDAPAPASPTCPDWRSRTVAQSDWQVLDAFAARTYVPETEASRAAGAGPGTEQHD